MQNELDNDIGELDLIKIIMVLLEVHPGHHQYSQFRANCDKEMIEWQKGKDETGDP